MWYCRNWWIKRIPVQFDQDVLDQQSQRHSASAWNNVLVRAGDNDSRTDAHQCHDVVCSHRHLYVSSIPTHLLAHRDTTPVHSTWVRIYPSHLPPWPRVGLAQNRWDWPNLGKPLRGNSYYSPYRSPQIVKGYLRHAKIHQNVLARGPHRLLSRRSPPKPPGLRFVYIRLYSCQVCQRWLCTMQLPVTVVVIILSQCSTIVRTLL